MLEQCSEEYDEHGEWIEMDEQPLQFGGIQNSEIMVLLKTIK